jgi:hypothetical protein
MSMILLESAYKISPVEIKRRTISVNPTFQALLVTSDLTVTRPELKTQSTFCYPTSGSHLLAPELCMPTCSSRFPAFPFLPLTFCIVLVANFITGCGGGGSATDTPLQGNTSVTLIASSTAKDQLSELTLNITGITLTNKEGKTVTLLNTRQYVEFMHLNGGIEPLTTVSIPQDVYTSATVSVSDGVPLCETVDPSSGNSGTYSVQTARAGEVQWSVCRRIFLV